MGTAYRLLLVACGLVAAAGIIIQRRPDAKQVFDRICPYTGLMGVALLAISILYLSKYIGPYLDSFLSSMNGWVAVSTGVVALLLGSLLGFGLISKLLGGRSPDAAAKGEAMRLRLAVSQIPFGLAGVGLGIYACI